MNQRTTLVLLTNIFPYGYGEGFLETELIYLSKSFENIIILPLKKSSRIRALPENVSVSDILTKEKKLFNINNLLPVLRSKEFREVLIKLTYRKRILYFLSLLIFHCKSDFIKKTVEFYINNNILKISNFIFYTYWLNFGTYGLGLLKQERSELKLVSRAHRFEIYTESRLLNFIPMQLENIKMLDKLFLISKDGYQYFINRYSTEHPWILNKMQISRLGVEKGNPIAIRSKPSSVFKIITCSNFGKVKRLDILINALAILDKKALDKKIEWTHVGGNKTFWNFSQRNYEKLAKKKLNSNVYFKFHGVLSHDNVINIFQTNWFDVFINVSDSEGIPVSIMEAQSYGIPVIARNVGGNSEIVNDKNGWLLDPHIIPEKLAEILLTLINSENMLLKKRPSANAIWESRFNAEKNYCAFINALGNL